MLCNFRVNAVLLPIVILVWVLLPMPIRLFHPSYLWVKHAALCTSSLTSLIPEIAVRNVKNPRMGILMFSLP